MSRIKKSQKNITVSLIFFIISFLVALVSRRTFIEAFGNDLVGLSSTMSNIIGFLSLADLGIGSAIAVLLYKPVFEDNKKEISNIISIFGFLYKYVGLAILALGFIVAPFLLLIFEDRAVEILSVYAAYATYLGSIMITYFISYKQSILDVYQKNYILTFAQNTSIITKIIIQIILIKYFSNNYLLWLSLELIFGFVYGFWVNNRVKKLYPWLKSSINNGKKNIKHYKHIIATIKKIAPHKLANVVLKQTDNILIFAFTSLKTVTLYTNYLLIISKIVAIMAISISGMYSSIGSLIESKDERKISRVYSVLQLFFFSAASILMICCYFLIEPFISIWLGSEYVLDKSVLILLLLSSYIGIVRIPTDLYNNGYILYHDIWAPYTEASLNLGLSLILGYYYGLTGVMLGTFISLFFIIFLWKPFFLYREGFKKPIMPYWTNVFKHLVVAVLAFISVTIFAHNIYTSKIETFIDWTIYGAIIFCLTSSIVLVLTLISFKESKLVWTLLKYKQI